MKEKINVILSQKSFNNKVFEHFKEKFFALNALIKALYSIL
jgi:hypothetical protein